VNPVELPWILYPIVMVIVGLGWLALLVFPRRQWANLWFAGVAVPLALSLIYMAVFLAYWYLEPRGKVADFLTLAGIYRMFDNDGLLLAVWINIISMDLVAGAWMTRKAVQTRMPLYLLYPCLLVTFVFAGFGFALFSVVASIGGRWSRISDVEEVPPVDSQPVLAVPGLMQVAE